MAELAPEIVEFYSQGNEVARLSAGLGRLEFERLKHLLSRFFPTPPATVADVGGGPGSYAAWLASRGYAVQLIDPIPLHVEQALEVSSRQPACPIASCRVGDARELPFEDRTFDAALLHGPLYHLTERMDRVRALSECRRVLRPGGVLAAVAISRYASTVLGIVKGWIWDRAYFGMIRDEIATGHHRRPEGWRVFTTAYFHDPSELQDELAEAELQHDLTVGIQGPVWLAPGFETIALGSSEWTVLMDTAKIVECEPALSPHFFSIARRSV
jgi:ubiquinone/menaquinone biosynthesis C-methylase UbiE